MAFRLRRQTAFERSLARFLRKRAVLIRRGAVKGIGSLDEANARGAGS